jgi:hypothetical protein
VDLYRFTREKIENNSSRVGYLTITWTKYKDNFVGDGEKHRCEAQKRQMYREARVINFLNCGLQEQVFVFVFLIL